MANATSLANRIEAIFDEEEPEQSWMDNRVRYRYLFESLTKAGLSVFSKIFKVIALNLSRNLD